MAIQRVEVITGAERRRQFSDEEKLRLVEEAFQPGAKATAVARRLGVDVGVLCRWRPQFFGRQPRLPAFIPITVATDDPPSENAAVPPTPEPLVPPAGTIEVEFAAARLRIRKPLRVGVGDVRVPTAARCRRCSACRANAAVVRRLPRHR